MPAVHAKQPLQYLFIFKEEPFLVLELINFLKVSVPVVVVVYVRVALIAIHKVYEILFQTLENFTLLLRSVKMLLVDLLLLKSFLFY